MPTSADERTERKEVHNVSHGQLSSDKQADVQIQEGRIEDDGKAQFVTPERTSDDPETGTLSKPLDDYYYTSQSDTPRIPSSELTAQRIHGEIEESAINPKASDTSLGAPSATTNIQPIDAHSPPVSRSTGFEPAALSHNKSASRGTNYTTEDEDASFAADVLKSLEAAERSIMTKSPPDSPKMTTEQPPPSKSPTPPGTDGYASSNYWAQMRANLKEKRSIGHDMSRTSSHKTGDLTEEIVHKTASPGPQSSNESSHSVKPASDGRSGSFTSYTPIPKFSDPNRPSSPGGGIPYGQPAYPSLDTTGARKHFPGSTGEPTQPRRGSASDAKTPQIDARGYIPAGNLSASSSPIAGAMPFSYQHPSGPGSRPSSRKGNRDEDVMGELPVFAPKEGLPDIYGVEERIGQQNPAWGGHVPPQARSQSPGYGISPARVLPLSQGMDKTSRTPSPLEDIPEENKEMEAPITTRTPNPLKKVPVPTAIPVNIPPQTGSIPKVLTHVVTPTPPSPPIAYTQTPEPISSQLENQAALHVFPPINIPPLAQVEADRSTPSPDDEWKDDEEPEVVPTDKRTTVFLQEAGKRKEAQGLPPLPTEAPPPILWSPTPADVIPEERLEDVVERTQDEEEDKSEPQHQHEVMGKLVDDPVERLKKHFQIGLPAPLNPPPMAPVPETEVPASETENDFSVQDDSVAQMEVVESAVEPPSKSTHAASASIPSLHRPETPMTNPPSVNSGSPSVGRGNVVGSLAHELPELDVLRPMTWGPLVLERPPQTPPELPTLVRGHEIMHGKVTKEGSTNNEPMDNKPQEDTEIIEDEVMGEGANDRSAEDEGQKDDESESEWEEVEKEDVEDEPSFQRVEEVEESKYISMAGGNLVEPPTALDDTIKPRAPPESESEAEEEISPLALNKGKEKEVYVDDPHEALSSDYNTDHDSVVGSKYINRDITSFIVPRKKRNTTHQPKPSVPPLQTKSDRPPSGNQISLDLLPPFMLSGDIPDMSTVAQRVGAYQSRRDQMLKADTGLLGWLVQIQQKRPPNIPQRMSNLDLVDFRTPGCATAF